MKYPCIFLLISLCLLAGCATSNIKTTPDTHYKLTGHLDRHLKIVTYGGESTVAAPTTLASAGNNVYISTTTGKPRELGNWSRTSHAKYLEQTFNNNNTFLSAEYIGDEQQNVDHQTYLRIFFSKEYQGEDGWPYEITAQYSLIDGENTIWNKEYEVSANTLGSIFSCANCLSSYVALEKLNKMVLTDLNILLGGDNITAIE